jgi:hypothetical protein
MYVIIIYGYQRMPVIIRDQTIIGCVMHVMMNVRLGIGEIFIELHGIGCMTYLYRRKNAVHLKYFEECTLVGIIDNYAL